MRARISRHVVPKSVKVPLFGWHTRYLVVSYLRYTATVTGGVLAVALGIDLAQQLDGVLAAAAPGFFGHVGTLVWYCLLRSADILARNFPLALYFAILWAELDFARHFERLALGTAGRSPFQALIPVVLVAAVFVTAQVSLDFYLRPAAVLRQSEEGLGDYGKRFTRQEAAQLHWIRLGPTAILSARIEPGPALKQVTLYRLGAGGELHEIIIARAAVPGPDPADWNFREGFFSVWNDGAFSANSIPAQAGPVTGQFHDRSVPLPLDPLWISRYGIDAKYLPEPTLEKLAGSHGLGAPMSDYRTWVQVRYARVLYVLGMCLLAAALGQMSIGGLPNVYRLLPLMLAGYVAHVGVRAFEILGELGAVPAAVAGWTIPIVLLFASAAVQANNFRRIG